MVVSCLFLSGCPKDSICISIGPPFCTSDTQVVRRCWNRTTAVPKITPTPLAHTNVALYELDVERGAGIVVELPAETGGVDVGNIGD